MNSQIATNAHYRASSQKRSLHFIRDVEVVPYAACSTAACRLISNAVIVLPAHSPKHRAIICPSISPSLVMLTLLSLRLYLVVLLSVAHTQVPPRCDILHTPAVVAAAPHRSAHNSHCLAVECTEAGCGCYCSMAVVAGTGSRAAHSTVENCRSAHCGPQAFVRVPTLCHGTAVHRIVFVVVQIRSCTN